MFQHTESTLQNREKLKGVRIPLNPRRAKKIQKMLSKHRKLTENFEHFEFGELSNEYLLAKVGFDTAENEP